MGMLRSSIVSGMRPIPAITTSRPAFSEYITFQYPLGNRTLFEYIYQLEPAHALLITPQGEKMWRFWDVHYHIDYDSNPAYCSERLEALLQESIRLHSRSDVAIGAYVSGGIDSSVISILASKENHKNLPLFHGRFLEDKAYDEQWDKNLERIKLGRYASDMLDVIRHVHKVFTEGDKKVVDVYELVDFLVTMKKILKEFPEKEKANG